jgi:acetyl esterase/lipase
MAPASAAPVPPSETTCYYDNSLPDLDAEARFAGCEARCRVDVHLPPSDDGAAVGEARSLLLFVHGGTWRVGDRRSMMFYGRHAELAQYHNCVVLSVGYRRSRMPNWVFFGLYPVRARAVLSLLTLFVCAPPS